MSTKISTAAGDIAAAIYSGVAPSAGDDLIIATAVTVTSNQTFNSVTAAGTGTLTSTGTNTLTLAGGFKHSSATAFVSISSGSLSIFGAVSVNASANTFSGSYTQNLLITGAVTQNGGNWMFSQLNKVTINGAVTITSAANNSRFASNCTSLVINGNTTLSGSGWNASIGYSTATTINGTLNVGSSIILATNGTGTLLVNGPGGMSRSRSMV